MKIEYGAYSSKMKCKNDFKEKRYRPLGIDEIV